MRGKIEQNPVIIDVAHSTSSDSGSTLSRDSDDSSPPETPPTDSENQDRRYVWKNGSDGPIQRPYDTAKLSKHTQHSGRVWHEEKERGRKSVPKLDTDLARNGSAGGPPPTLERERSPYASGPHDRKPKPERFSGEYLLSPDVTSPRKTFTESPRSQQQYFPRSAENRISGRPDQGTDSRRAPARPPMDTHRAKSHYAPRPIEVPSSVKHAQAADSPRTSDRPSIIRRASELPHSDEPPIVGRRPTWDSNGLRQTPRPTTDTRGSDSPYPSSPPLASGFQPQTRDSRRPYSRLDDSDSDHTKSTRSSAQVSDRISRQSTTFSSKEARHHERNLSSEMQTPKSKRSGPSSHGTTPPVNLSSLVSGAAIAQTLNSMLDGEDAAARRASPRPSPGVSPLVSPHGSPKTSPYSSPPRTPPSESFQHRSNPVANLKKDAPGSRPSSPLSSRSSTWTVDHDSSPREDYNSGASRPGPLKSRKTAPLPTENLDRSRGAEHLAAPGINIRSPSPAQHANSSSAGSGNPTRSKMESAGGTSDHHSRPSDLRPAGLSSRPRSASSTDVRSTLTINPAPFLQASNSPVSPSLNSKSTTPGLSSPSDRYKPAYLEPESFGPKKPSSRLEAGNSGNRERSRSRSRSYAPDYVPSNSAIQSSNLDPTRSALRSRSTMPIPGANSTRSSSTAAKPTSPKVVPIPPGKLPTCPRPQPTAGYDDWFTLQDNAAFAICPSCRDDVFGADYAHYLQRRSENSSRKTLCDLNNPWVRLALSLRGPDAKLLSALSDVTSKERSCPGDELAPRDWYRLEDAETGKHISGVNACPHCVQSLEVILPAWQNVFYRSRSSHSHELKERFCALRASPTRFGDYLNLMVESAQEADSRRKAANTRLVCELAKQLAAIDDCPRDKMFARKAWHMHPHLPEFTICQECYENVVYPMAKNGLSLAAKIDKKPLQFPNPESEACCHLYSPRMRRVFREACEDDDYEHLRHTVLKRHMLQQDILGTFKEMSQHPGDREVDDRLRDLLERWKDKE